MTFGGGNEQEFIGKLTQLTLDHLADENFGGKELALALGMSWSTLNRKLQALTGKHISQLIREIRLQRALELLQENNATAAEVAYKVGFGGPAYFNKCFNDFYGFPPGEVKKRLEDGTLPLVDENLPTEISFPETTSLSILGRLPKPYRIAAFAGLALLIIALGMVFLAKKGDFSYHLQGKEKSIAVLPFKNLSGEADNQYFADGITEDILNHLFRISDLRVMSRTTAERFRDSELSTTEIAKAMGVNYLLEGSVRKQDDRVRITVQLIDGKSDRHLWSENYDRQLADIFFIQSDIAQNVARELRAILSPKEIENIERPLTQNIGAYDFYLRGKEYHNRSNNEEDFRFAMQMYQKAVDIDPDFALAWAGLAACSRLLYWFKFDLSDEILLETKQYLEKALALAPALKEVRLEEGLFYYYCKRDYLRSMEILTKLKIDYPNDHEIYFYLAMVYRRIGKFEKSLEYNNLAISLNPSLWWYWSNASFTFEVLKNFPKAEYYHQKSIDLNPSYSQGYNYLLNMYLKTGQIKKAKDFLVLNEKHFEPQNFLRFQGQLEFFSRNYSKAIHFLQLMSEEGIYWQDQVYSKHLELGKIYHMISDPERSILHFGLARNFYLEKLNESDFDWRLWGSFGVACAGLGLEKESMDAGEKSMELLNLSLDAYIGLYPQMHMVIIYALLEEYDEAILMLERIISYTGIITTVEELKLDPFWDPVREHPKFKEIINNPAYQIRL